MQDISSWLGKNMQKERPGHGRLEFDMLRHPKSKVTAKKTYCIVKLLVAFG